MFLLHWNPSSEAICEIIDGFSRFFSVPQRDKSLQRSSVITGRWCSNWRACTVSSDERTLNRNGITKDLMDTLVRNRSIRDYHSQHSHVVSNYFTWCPVIVHISADIDTVKGFRVSRIPRAMLQVQTTIRDEWRRFFVRGKVDLYQMIFCEKSAGSDKKLLLSTDEMAILTNCAQRVLIWLSESIIGGHRVAVVCVDSALISTTTNGSSAIAQVTLPLFLPFSIHKTGVSIYKARN